MKNPSIKAKHKPPDTYKRNSLEGVVDTSSFTTATRLLIEGPSLGQASTSTGGLTTQNENPPLLCFLQGLNIKMCYGCIKKFDQKLTNLPHNMILKRLVRRDRLINNKWVAGWQKKQQKNMMIFPLIY